ncbi:hypothetical protein HK100_005231 [Physocladia obscura]|uniref:Uncharacterized protein n=1 Tax=Physocladia obscura TaxID=109957 RepID=A0AAD5X9G8_9FUNG|nr:hypothetical protein HK100_005231 [Physocladia obscura]
MLSSASSACYGIEIRDGESAAEGGVADSGGVLRLSANEKHGRKIDVRRAFDVFREAVMRDAEATVRLAQAECAWLCDRIAALPSAPSSPTTQLATQQTTTTKQSQQHTTVDPLVSPINKEPFALSSSSPVAASSLLSRHLGAASSSVVAQVGPPILEHLPPATTTTISAAAPEPPRIFSASSSSVNLSRKVHFKEEPTTGTSTISVTAATPVALSSFPLNEPKNGTGLSVEGTASSADPASSSSVSPTKSRRPVPTSPAPTNGQKIVFAKQRDTDSGEDVFSIDDAASSSTIERYLGDDEDDEDDDEDDADDERDDKPPISLLSSSIPIAIARDPRGGDSAAYERKPKKKNTNETKKEFIAPHEIVAKSYQTQAEMGGSVVGRPFPSTSSASVKKSSVAI